MDAEKKSDRQEMETRTKDFALRVVKLVSALPKGQLSNVLGYQLLKSGTSIGANYCEANHASSKKQFVSIMEIALRESSETIYWLDLIISADVMPEERLKPLTQECTELRRILTSAILTTKQNMNREF